MQSRSRSPTGKPASKLTAERLGQRRVVAVRRSKADLAHDLGADPSRAQATLIKLAAWNRITDTEPR